MKIDQLIKMVNELRFDNPSATALNQYQRFRLALKAQVDFQLMFILQEIE